MKTAIGITIAVVLGVVALGAALFYGPVVAPVQQALGSIVGPDVSQQMFFHQNITVGGQDIATTSTGSFVLPASYMVSARVIESNSSGAATMTLPTNANLSAAGYLPYVGDSQSEFVHASTTGITVAGNTGVVLSSASSTPFINAGQVGKLECVRLGATEARKIWCLLIAD